VSWRDASVAMGASGRSAAESRRARATRFVVFFVDSIPDMRSRGDIQRLGSSDPASTAI
jgi:hypothetical protein